MQVETALPELPFTNYGKADFQPWTNSPYVPTSEYRQTRPRTDLTTLNPWISFPNDVHQAIECATTSAGLTPKSFMTGSTMTSIVSQECEIRIHAMVTLHESVKDVMGMFGIKGRFTSGRNTAVIGDPDFSWIAGKRDTLPCSKLIVQYKAWWIADLIGLPNIFTSPQHTVTGTGEQSLDALEQIYGYMTFSNVKFGILSNWQRAWFLRRPETADCKTLEYFLVELDGSGSPISMLKAWVGIVLLAENDCTSPILYPDCAPSNRNLGEMETAWQEQNRAIHDAGEYHIKLPSNGVYELVPLDIRLCRFDLSSARRGAIGCAVHTQILPSSAGENSPQILCKAVDILRHPESLMNEVSSYAALQHLQGQVVPTFYGFYEVWGILQLLALQPVGDAIPEGEEISQTLRLKMKATLQRIHDAGYIHGDVARRNFCRTPRGDIFLVDLERCRQAKNLSELADELRDVDEL